MEIEKGKIIKNGGFTKTTPRKWTINEIEFVKKMIFDGKTYKEIATILDRSEVSVSIKAKRMQKKDNTYNIEHINEKYSINQNFIDKLKPNSILDVYCGCKSFYKNKCNRVITNDIDKNILADFHLDAYKFLCKEYYENNKYDIIDLDPFGSAYDCFDLAIKMAKKGIAITLGELGHKRWKRLDYVERYYGIDNFNDFNIENLIKYIQCIGRRNKKELIIFDYKEWKNIGRVWFEIKPYKITKQWDDIKIGQQHLELF